MNLIYSTTFTPEIRDYLNKRANEIAELNKELTMARPKGSKNKTVAEKVEDMVEDVTALLPKASEAQAAEIVEAVEELQDIIDADEEATIKFPNGSTIKLGEVKEGEKLKGVRLVGRHPVTKEPVYK